MSSTALRQLQYIQPRYSSARNRGSPSCSPHYGECGLSFCTGSTNICIFAVLISCVFLGTATSAELKVKSHFIHSKNLGNVRARTEFKYFFQKTLAAVLLLQCWERRVWKKTKSALNEWVSLLFSIYVTEAPISLNTNLLSELFAKQCFSTNIASFSVRIRLQFLQAYSLLKGLEELFSEYRYLH